jgi:hypothetical protein
MFKDIFLWKDQAMKHRSTGTLIAQRNTIGTRQWPSSNRIRKGFTGKVSRNDIALAAAFFSVEQREFLVPVRTTDFPKMKGKLEFLTFKGRNFVNEKVQELARNKELENSVIEKGRFEVRHRATNGALD